MCTGCCTKGGSSGPMQCVLKEGGCEFNPVATGCTGNARECEEVWREWHRVLCVELEEERQLVSFASKMSSWNVFMSLRI